MNIAQTQHICTYVCTCIFPFM